MSTDSSEDWIVDSVLRSQKTKPLGCLLSSPFNFPPLLLRHALLRFLRSKQHESSTSDSVWDWESLPSDLLLSICSHLTLPDCARLLAVCASWATLPRKDLSSAALRSPWLAMMQPCNDRRIYFQSPSDRRSYDTPFLHKHIRINHFKCVGHRDGWLVIVFADLEVYLFNPLTLQKIRLPSFNTVHGPNKVIHFHYIGKVVLSSRPSAHHGFTAVLIYKSKYLAFAKAGADAWTKLYFRLERYRWSWEREWEVIDDVVFHEEKVFVICDSGRFLAFDLSGTHPTKVFESTVREIHNGCHRRRLLPCLSGRLLQLVCRFDSGTFLILEFSPGMDKSCWLEIEELDADICLFLDDHGCVVVSAGDEKLKDG